MQPKVSVIVPVYNVEQYLRQCLDSLINQTLKDIEIICVNDGSTDNSLEILQSYAKQDDRIQIIEQENKGLGAARNVGIDCASADYIMFLDSDDWLETNACEVAYNHISCNDNEFVLFNYFTYFENQPSHKRWDCNKFNGLLLQNDINHINPANIKKPFVLGANAWFKIYKTDFIRKNNIKFLVGYAFEDQTFWTECFCNSSNISIINLPLLNYRQRDNSISNNIQNWQDYIYAVQQAILLIPATAPNSIKDIITLSKIASLLYWFKKYKDMNDNIKDVFYAKIHDTLCMCDKECLRRCNKYYNAVLVNIMLRWKSYTMFKFNLLISKINVQDIFSVKNTKNKKHKVIKVLGIKLKFRKRSWGEKYNDIRIVQNRVVIDNFAGNGFGCNPKYIAKEIKKQILPCEIIWLVKDQHQNNIPQGIKTVNYSSEQAFKYLASSKFIVSNIRLKHFINNGFIKKADQCYIQTWHGCLAFKKIEKDIKHNKSYADYLAKAEIDSKYIDYLISPSRFDTNILKNCFYYDGKILEIGYPRDDIFFYDEKEQEKIKNTVLKILDIPKNKKIVLYAPTFRDSKRLDMYKLNADMLLEVLNKKYNSDFVFVTRLHPNILNKSPELTTLYPNAINASGYDDIQELLLVADILITDYSSCIFDFCLTFKPAFVYATDIEEYKKERGFYLDIDSMPFPVAQTETKLFDNIAKFDENEYKSSLAMFLQKRIDFNNGTASEKIVEIIKNGIK